MNIKLSFPPFITVFNKENLINSKSAENFCIEDTKKVLNNDLPFPGRSVFFSDFENLEEINEAAEHLNQNNIISSPHFLAPFIHEWLHSFHLDYIYSKYGYGGNCGYLKKVYPAQNTKQSGIDVVSSLKSKKLSPEENSIVEKELGQYSVLTDNQYFEIVSETFTKYIGLSLKGGKLVNNPIELLKKAPPEFKEILKKVLSAAL